MEASIWTSCLLLSLCCSTFFLAEQRVTSPLLLYLMVRRGPIPTILFSSCTCTAETSTWTEHTNKNMTKPIILKMGIRHTGGAKAPPLEFMATWIQGIYFDFNIKVDNYQQEVTVDTPVEGLKVVTSQYSNGEAGYSFSVGPINLYTALQLFNSASSYMVQSNTAG